ncbi:hydantoinase/oxoprolinase family protein, partial [Shewanella sp. A25]|nr:hydantoinase/oxoprolinase family protein [Shewanella shenzhenensis]
MNYRGEGIGPVDLSGLAAILEYFRQQDVQAIGICSLHASLNPAQELAPVDAIKQLWPGIEGIASRESSSGG